MKKLLSFALIGGVSLMLTSNVFAQNIVWKDYLKNHIELDGNINVVIKDINCETTTKICSNTTEETTKEIATNIIEPSTEVTTDNIIIITTEATTNSIFESTTEAATDKITETTTETTTNNQNNNYKQQVLNLVNKERANAGLKPLTLNSEVSNVAQIKAEDMMKNNYFSHTSPTYGTPFQMLQRFDVNYNYAGENIAKGQKTPEAVVNAWMNSEGHRANILNPKYTQLGVGYINENTSYWVQMFIG